MMTAAQESTSRVKRSNHRSHNHGLLRWINLRPEESDRTFLLFAFYSVCSIGSLWLEVSVGALFLEKYGAGMLPWIYIGSAVIGAGVGVLYSWLQRFLSLSRVIVLAAVLTAVPLFLFPKGLDSTWAGIWTLFVARLWFEVVGVVNELNTSMTANQLFTIREIKRTYPFISSGILIADVVSGFSLPWLRRSVGLPNVIYVACGMLLLSAFLLHRITRKYRTFFPNTSRRRSMDKPDFLVQRSQDSQYVKWVLVVFAMVQVLAVLLDFQYLGQVETNLNVEAGKIADFLAIFSAILGVVELAAQWFISSRILERLNVFLISGFPPAIIAVISSLAFLGVFPLFQGTIGLKFTDELLRYTLVASTAPVLFQPLPKASRNRIQALVRGIAEPLSTGLTGGLMLLIIWGFNTFTPGNAKLYKDTFLLLFTAIFALLWCLALWQLHSRYVKVLVLGADRKQLSQNVDLSSMRRDITNSLARARTESERKPFVEVLIQVDPRNAGEVLAPYLLDFSPELQYKTLEAMMQYPNVAHLRLMWSLIDRGSSASIDRDQYSVASTEYGKHQSSSQSAGKLKTTPLQISPLQISPLQISPQISPLQSRNQRQDSGLDRPIHPEVFALALRYIWNTDANTNIHQLKLYLKPETDPVVRSTAAALLLRWGDSTQKAEATAILRKMLTHKEERERVMGCRALGEAVYLQSLRIYIEPLLRDKSLRVRCATLEAIATTQQEKYYTALERGFIYKSTREAAKRAFLRLQDDAIPLLLNLVGDPYNSEIVRSQAYATLGQIGSAAAIGALVSHLMTTWGSDRTTILRILLKIPHEEGIEVVTDLMGRSGIETLMEQELKFVAHLYAAIVDLTPDSLSSGLTTALSPPPTPLHTAEAETLRRALRNSIKDSIDRLLLLLQFLSDPASIQAADFNLQSGSLDSFARGLEILDYTVQTASKPIILNIIDRQPDVNKLQSLQDLLEYDPLSPSDRIRQLICLRHFLPAWTLACCFHLARQARWNITTEPILASLNHPAGFVREAVLHYLRIASPKVLYDLLPRLAEDSDRLVAAQARQAIVELQVDATQSLLAQK